MENSLRTVEENSAEEGINKDRLKYFTTKIKIWDCFNISQQNFISLSTDERSSMLKRYYHNLNSRYLAAGKSFFLYFSSFFAFWFMKIVVENLHDLILVIFCL